MKNLRKIEIHTNNINGEEITITKYYNVETGKIVNYTPSVFDNIKDLNIVCSILCKQKQFKGLLLPRFAIISNEKTTNEGVSTITVIIKDDSIIDFGNILNTTIYFDNSGNESGLSLSVTQIDSVTHAVSFVGVETGLAEGLMWGEYEVAFNNGMVLRQYIAATIEKDPFEVNFLYMENNISVSFAELDVVASFHPSFYLNYFGNVKTVTNSQNLTPILETTSNVFNFQPMSNIKGVLHSSISGDILFGLGGFSQEFYFSN